MYKRILTLVLALAVALAPGLVMAETCPQCEVDAGNCEIAAGKSAAEAYAITLAGCLLTVGYFGVTIPACFVTAGAASLATSTVLSAECAYTLDQCLLTCNNETP
jgi:hypothetical protein